MSNKKGFSFVELIISITILILISVIGYGSLSDYNNTRDNTKIVTDIETVKNSVTLMSQETNLSLPDGNKNFFDASGDYSSSGNLSFGVYGKLTQNTIPKRFLDIVPLDPKTNQYYSYGVAIKNNQFEIAGIIKKDDNYLTKLSGNYTAENGLFGLIRGYNSPYFITDEGNILPYNPEERILTATDTNGKIYRQGDKVITGAGETLELFFSDGSVTKLGENTTLTLTNTEFPSETNLISKVKLYLEAGVIWTKATKLDEDSHFEVFTNDATAAVRGTIFAVQKEANNTQVKVIEGKVEVVVDSRKAEINSGESITINTQGGQENGSKIIGDKPEDIFEDYNNSNPNIVENGNNQEDENQLIENKSCILDGVEIKHGQTISAYSTNTSDNCSNYTGERVCNNGELIGEEIYKYYTCSPAGKCGNYNKNGFISTGTLINGDDINLTKSKTIKGGTETYNIRVQCINSNFVEGSITKTLNCDGKNIDGDSYIVDGASCKLYCGTGGFEYTPDRCAKNELGGEWQVYAYAPFDDNLNIYSKNGTATSTYKNLNLCGEEYLSVDIGDHNGKICKDGEIKGIVVENFDNNNDDFYKIENLSLSGNFAIEMSVRGEALKRKYGIYTLFDNGDIVLKNMNGIITLGYYDKTYRVVKYIQATDITLNNNDFYNIIATFELNNWDLKINNNGSNNGSYAINKTLNYIFIGNKEENSYYNEQWNDIINYIKIYN